jgi:predicted NAD/FAD-binding protein
MCFVKGGISNVCTKLSSQIHKISCNTTVVSISQDPITNRFILTSKPTTESAVSESESTTKATTSLTFDHIILATQANQSHRILKTLTNKTHQTTRLLQNLSRIPYAQAVVVCHTDARQLPRSTRRCMNFGIPLRKSSGCVVSCTHATDRTHPEFPPQYLQTTNPVSPIDASCVLSETVFERACVSFESLQAVRCIRENQGSQGLWFVGSYITDGIPLLEGCLESALDVYEGVCGRVGVERGRVEWDVRGGKTELENDGVKEEKNVLVILVGLCVILVCVWYVLGHSFWPYYFINVRALF